MTNYWKQRCEAAERVAFCPFEENGKEFDEAYAEWKKARAINPPEDKPKRSKEEIIDKHFEQLSSSAVPFELPLVQFEIIQDCMEEYASQGIELPSDDEIITELNRQELSSIDEGTMYSDVYFPVHSDTFFTGATWMRDYIKNQMK
jgi:hypothetical protein